MSNLYSATRHLHALPAPPDDEPDTIPADVDECIDELATRGLPEPWRRTDVRTLGPVDGAA